MVCLLTGADRIAQLTLRLGTPAQRNVVAVVALTLVIGGLVGLVAGRPIRLPPSVKPSDIPIDAYLVEMDLRELNAWLGDYSPSEPLDDRLPRRAGAVVAGVGSAHASRGASAHSRSSP